MRTIQKFREISRRASEELLDSGTKVFAKCRDTCDRNRCGVSLNANLEIGHYDWRAIAGDFDLSLTRFHGVELLNSVKISMRFRGETLDFGNATFVSQDFRDNETPSVD